MAKILSYIKELGLAKIQAVYPLFNLPVAKNELTKCFIVSE
jgi:hypothetical protein